MSNLYAQAQAYAARGWSVIPIRSDAEKKIPAVRWKRFQNECPADALLRRWFTRCRFKTLVVGLALITGPVSGGVCVRDFDTMESYERWAAEHRDLARTLPTVETTRGRHVYFFGNNVKSQTFIDGELKGPRVYVCLPPTLHPSGKVYRWLIPLPDGPLPMVADVAAAGLVGKRKPKPSPKQRRSRANVGGPATRPMSAGVDPMGELVAQALGDVAEGSRNERGVWLACQLRDAGMAQAQAEGTMQEYAGRVPNPNPPTYTADDALATVRSVYATPARAPAFRSGTWHNHLPAWIHALNLRPFAHRLLQAVANMCNAQPIDGYGSLGFCYAKAETLAKAAGMSERTLQRRMPKMLGNGLVVLISRGGKDKGMRCAHVYAIPGVRGVLNHVRYKGNAARRIDRVTVGHRTIPVGDGGASGNASPCPTSSPSGADRMTDCHPAKELAYSGGADCHPLPRNVL